MNDQDCMNNLKQAIALLKKIQDYPLPDIIREDIEEFLREVRDAH